MRPPAGRRSRPLLVGLLGAGAIGEAVVQAWRAGRLPDVELIAVAGASAGSASAARLAAATDARAVSPEALVECGCDCVLEAAGAAALRRHLPALWQRGCATVVMSVGALLEPEVEAAYLAALADGVDVVLPSGAIAGLDGVRALAAGGSLRRVSLTTTKGPHAWRGAPYLLAHGVDLPDDRVATVFEGSAREAAAWFPANANVAATLSLASLGPDATSVVLRSDPAAQRTSHVIEAAADEARIEVRVASDVVSQHPRTSWLAGASAASALVELARTLRR